ncbi:hypothetical protein P691DRAFT_812990 [Macrolepiota fuliginosa MF-IS2]|uniref:T-cell immunomodulatory protein TIP C2 domain-containing protein n=1 Tax=Macrolepiota fuliginosa MF-IS2 TaxID=1400762 RepID=A0A9P5XNH2_9AGAR|nr:hypothetical protein P691DRAFT_812990 [Macrolepiota fuliginosa MF-IS2]
MLPSLSTLWKTFLCSCIITTSLSLPGAAIWPFPKKRFTGTALVDAGSLGLAGDRRIVAYGDFDGDQFLDVLSLASDQQTLTVYYWNHESFVFQEGNSFKHPSKVLNVVPGDFTHSGKQDILVMSKGRNGNEIDMLVYPLLPKDGFDTTHPMSVQSSTTAQPIPLDVNGDLKIDLLGLTVEGRSQLQVWQNVWNSSLTNSPLFEMQNSHFEGSQCNIANPHSNAVVDLNGDCLADVFLVCDEGRGQKSYQIWLNKKSQGFVLATQGALPTGTQSISFADLDRDGTIDMIFTTCKSVSSDGVGSDCYVNVAYNQQLGLCSSATDSGIKNGVRICRPPNDLCTADDNFKFDLRDSADNEAFIRFPISSLFPDHASLLVTDVTYDPPIPISLRLGDTNSDGFPEFLAIIALGSDRTPHLVYSVPCGPGVAGCKPDGSGKRGWKVADAGTKALGNVKDARGISFLDMDEDGTLDILVQRTGSQDGSKVLFVQNNFYYDAFFLKAIVLSGACNSGRCYSSYSGASYKYTVFDTSGHRSAAQVGQLPQTSYHALQTPYSFFGLGRTNNYIENLFVGTTLHASEHYINLEGVVPNSRVVILPPPDGSGEGGEGWKRELFLRPGEWIPWVSVTCVVGMVVLAIIVFVLHLNEKREDELERRRASHHINFDAL